MPAPTLATEPPDSLAVDLTRERWRERRLAFSPCVLALVVSVPLAAAYLVLEPPSGNLAAATYRGEIFARAGVTLWDGGWYGGHYLPGYSLLAPALGALVGERLLLAPVGRPASAWRGIRLSAASPGLSGTMSRWQARRSQGNPHIGSYRVWWGFLCGDKIGRNTQSRQHVFPDWLEKFFIREDKTDEPIPHFRKLKRRGEEMPSEDRRDLPFNMQVKVLRSSRCRPGQLVD